MRAFFLAKSGESFGPYSEGDIESLRDSGEYQRFTWLWDTQDPRWQPIDPPPAPPVAVLKPVERGESRPSEYSAPAAMAAPAPVLAPAFTISERMAEKFRVLCYDHHSVLAGKLQNVTDGGCEFVSENGGDSPSFMVKLPVVLNLLEPSTGRTMNVQGRVGRAMRKDGQWRYRIYWKRCPEIMREAA